EAHNAGHVERARAHTALVAAAVHLGGHLHPRVFAAHVKRAYAFGAVHFVGREGHQVDAVGEHVNRNFTHGLGAVGHKQRAVLVGDGGNFADGLNGARLVVAVHDGHQNGLGRHGSFKLLKADKAFLVYGQVGYLAAELFDVLTRIEHSLVLGGGSDDVVAALAVVALSRTASEDNLLGVAVDELRNLSAGVVYAFLRCPAKGVVARGGVAEYVGEVGHHGLQHARVERRGGVVVQVDR
nr:hypothetical protein [Tanacetum cinerariifolium]